VKTRRSRPMMPPASSSSGFGRPLTSR